MDTRVSSALMSSVAMNPAPITGNTWEARLLWTPAHHQLPNIGLVEMGEFIGWGSGWFWSASRSHEMDWHMCLERPCVTIGGSSRTQQAAPACHPCVPVDAAWCGQAGQPLCQLWCHPRSICVPTTNGAVHQAHTGGNQPDMWGAEQCSGKGFAPPLEETSVCACEGAAASSASTPNAARMSGMVDERHTKPIESSFPQDSLNPQLKPSHGLRLSCAYGRGVYHGTAQGEPWRAQYHAVLPAHQRVVLAGREPSVRLQPGPGYPRAPRQRAPAGGGRQR